MGTLKTFGQDSISELRSELQVMDSTDESYLPLVIKFCEEVQYSEQAFLIPEYKEAGLKAAAYWQDSASMVRLHTIAGDYYWRSGMLAESAEEFNKIRILSERSNRSDWLALSSNGLGTVYYLMEKYPEALQYYQRGLSLVESDSALIIRFYNNIANVYTMQDQLDSVLYYYNKALDFDKSKQDYRKMSIAYMNLALAYERLEDIPEARKMVNLAIESANLSNDPNQKSYVYGVMGSFLYERHPEIAIGFYRVALEQAYLARSYDLVFQTLENLIGYYDSSGRIDSAYHYMSEAYYLKDSLDVVRKNRKVNEVESSFKWASDQIRAEHDSNEQEMERQNRENRQRTWLFILIVIVAALGVILYILFQTNLIKAQINKELETSNMTKDRFFSIMAHDLRSPISGAIGLSGIIEEEGREIKESRIGYYAKTLQTTLTDVKDLIESILQWAQVESGRMLFNPTSASIRELADNAISLLKDLSEAKGVLIQNKLPEDLHMVVDQNMLGTVFRNLISNGIKHTETGGLITVSCKSDDDSVVFEIADSGTGIPKEQLDKLFDNNYVFTTPGTRKERGTGLGLILCKEFVDQHQGTIQVESEPGKGTRVLISLPKLTLV